MINVAAKWSRKAKAAAASAAVLTTVMGIHLAVSGADGSGAESLIVVSASADRGSPRQLNGATISGAVAIFANVGAEIQKVEYFIDDPAMRSAPFMIERVAPFDLGGTASDGTAVMISTAMFGVGNHTLTQVTTDIDSSGQSELLYSFADFTVGTPAAEETSTTTTTLAPQTTTTSTTRPTTTTTSTTVPRTTTSTTTTLPGGIDTGGASITKPSQILGTEFTVMAPFARTGSSDSPENMSILQAEADPRYRASMFVRGSAVVFKATVGGFHSTNSSFARSELRELTGSSADDEASWSSKSGTHTIEGTYSVASTLTARPQVCIQQQHDAEDDVWMVCWDNNRIMAYWADKDKELTLIPSVAPGEKFTIKTVVTNGKVEFYANGELKGSAPVKGTTGLYFKSGCYLQSSPAKYGEPAANGAEVSIYALKITHS